jgi:hypothetical protein
MKISPTTPIPSLSKNFILMLFHVRITAILRRGFILEMGKSTLRKLHILPEVTQTSKDQIRI